MIALRVGLVVCATALLAATHWWAHGFGAAKVEHRWATQRASLAQAHADAIEAMRVSEQHLRNTSEALARKARDDEKRIRGERDRLAASLRDRPVARAATPTEANSSAGVGCTGAQLARGDAEFLVGFATDAARLSAALQQCRVAYEAARGALGEN